MDATARTVQGRRWRVMKKRTNEEIKAYVDGYNDCFEQFSECLKHRKSVMDAVRKMRMYREAVNNVLNTEEEQ
jgi:hypothetical protein